MDTSGSSQNQDPANANRSQKLMVSGLVRPKQVPEESGPTEVMRGMTILTKEGREAGQVAAVVVDSHSQVVTHLVLGRLRPALEYRLVPADLIEQVNAETVSLSILGQAVESLPARKAGGET
jgi:sporulation protein YlmC with PRC-barrel domain